MTNTEAFEHVELEIKAKRDRAATLRETRASATRSRAMLDTQAKFLDAEADALQLVLGLARRASCACGNVADPHRGTCDACMTDKVS